MNMPNHFVFKRQKDSKHNRNSDTNVESKEKHDVSNHILAETNSFLDVVQSKLAEERGTKGYYKQAKQFLANNPKLTESLRFAFGEPFGLTRFYERAVVICQILNEHTKKDLQTKLTLQELACKLFYEGHESEVTDWMEKTFLDETKQYIDRLRTAGVVSVKVKGDTQYLGFDPGIK